VVVAGELLLIDPLVFGNDDPAVSVLDQLVGNRVRILVTLPYHTRSAGVLWRRYRRASATIYGHAGVATRLDDASGFTAIAGGQDVGGIVRFHTLGSPPRSEQPIEIPGRQALVFGDAVVETGDGELRVWEGRLDSERRRRWYGRYLQSLERLAALNAEHILVTHGQPRLGDRAAALRRALGREPWQRPKS
jgi:glyoxylase-like metal-dependent hydrolase (beta-lactamase superfamily II)